mmetsp:Transcript_10869/g.25546  ORF Transcript_10869/g.25546 Transcript_10869/m.25546 type:complete len:218 (-) Transcript_10869:286-939(-)
MITAAPPSSIPRVSRSPSTAHAKMGLSAVSVHMMREDSVLGRRRLPSYIRALAKGSRTTLLSTSGGMASAANPESWKLKRRNDEITKRPRIAEGSMSMSDFQRVMVRRAPLKIGTTRATASPDPKLAKFSPLLTMSVTPPRTMGMATHVLQGMLTPRRSLLKNAAQKGEVAKISTTWATDVIFTETMKSMLAKPASVPTTMPHGPRRTKLDGTLPTP